MSHNTPKQHTLWLLAALTAPTAHFCGSGWFTTLLVALAILPLILTPRKWEDLPKPLVWIEILWLGIAAGLLLQNSAAYWPSDNDLVVPLTLLILAACTNAAAAPRIGAVLAFCMALLAIPLAASAATHIEPLWLEAETGRWDAGLALALLLPALPAAGEGKKGRRAVYASLAAVAAAASVQGIISPWVAASVPDPFYQTARTLGHLEPVAAAAMTLGWYAMTVFLLQSAAAIADGSGIRRKRACVLAVGTAAGSVLFLQQPNDLFVTVMSLFLWVLVPLATKMKDFEKSEK